MRASFSGYPQWVRYRLITKGRGNPILSTFITVRKYLSMVQLGVQPQGIPFKIVHDQLKKNGSNIGSQQLFWQSLPRAIDWVLNLFYILF